MTKVIKKDEVKVEEVKEVLSAEQQRALSILIQSVEIATKKGSFSLDDAVVIGNAKNFLQELIKK